MRLTAADMVRAINALPREIHFNYINPTTKTKVYIEKIIVNEGPIYIKRYNPSKKEGAADAKKNSISSDALWRYANAFRPGVPVNVDRVFGASYNHRSALESLLAHTPQFYYCYPGRIHLETSTTSIERGHKHLVWLPDSPHEVGKLCSIEIDQVISEIPSASAVYEALVLPEKQSHGIIDTEMARRHAHIQIAIVEIGRQLGYRTWIAQNDQGMIYKDRRVIEMETVIKRLQDENLLASFQEAQHAARMIDCIWFKNGRLMPAVIEVEHSTGVISGLTRMKNFKDYLPPFPTRWVIAAPDEDREKVMKACSLPQFKDLDALYFPYSAVDELFSLCQRRKIQGVSEEFLDSFMERCLPLLP